jgi:hypothetical protein
VRIAVSGRLPFFQGRRRMVQQCMNV